MTALETKPRSRWLQRLIISVATVSVLLGAAWLLRAPLLRGLASWWIIDDAPARADAIAVLGGGAQFRTFEAARLFHAGVAPKVAIMDVALSPHDEAKLSFPETQMLRRVLLHERVSESALVVVGHGVTSTREEAAALREWAVKEGVKSLIVPTDLFHTRRVSRLFRKTFAGTGVHVSVKAITPEEYTRENWWRREEGVLTFQNEIAKSALYAVRR